MQLLFITTGILIMRGEIPKSREQMVQVDGDADTSEEAVTPGRETETLPGSETVSATDIPQTGSMTGVTESEPVTDEAPITGGGGGSNYIFSECTFHR